MGAFTQIEGYLMLKKIYLKNNYIDAQVIELVDGSRFLFTGLRRKAITSLGILDELNHAQWDRDNIVDFDTYIDSLDDDPIDELFPHPDRDTYLARSRKGKEFELSASDTRALLEVV